MEFRGFNRDEDDIATSHALEALGYEYRGGRLCAFLGAGISIGCGLPSWPELNDRLFDKSFSDLFPAGGFDGTFEAPTGFAGFLKKVSINAVKEAMRTQSPIQRTRFAKRALGTGYLAALRRSLYSADVSYSDAIISLARLERLRAICTYNFDDLLEQCSSAHNRFESIASKSDALSSGRIPVFHVHGLLPNRTDASERGDLIFSEDDYHRVYRDPTHWSNVIQLSLLEQASCLLLGLSCEDPNIRRLLDSAKKRGASWVVMRYPGGPGNPIGYGAVPFGAVKQFQQESLEALGLKVIWIDAYSPDLACLISSLSSPSPYGAFKIAVSESGMSQKEPGMGPES